MMCVYIYICIYGVYIYCIYTYLSYIDIYIYIHIHTHINIIYTCISTYNVDIYRQRRNVHGPWTFLSRDLHSFEGYQNLSPSKTGVRSFIYVNPNKFLGHVNPGLINPNGCLFGVVGIEWSNIFKSRLVQEKNQNPFFERVCYGF